MEKFHEPITILRAEEKDVQEILDLQYLAYQSEAKVLNNFKIPPLTQTYNEIKEELEKGVILKAINEQNTILGSVRAYSEENTLYIGKLIVHPNKQKQGIGSALLLSIEQRLPHQRYELFTSSKSLSNIHFYQSFGYCIFKEKNITKDVSCVFLEKVM